MTTSGNGRTARLRELAHGRHTVLSGTTGDLVADVLPDDAWLNDLGTHRLRGLPRPERQTHLTHVYTKLGLTSRVESAQEAARRT
jgi:class 3 adenylate cyclase